MNFRRAFAETLQLFTVFAFFAAAVFFFSLSYLPETRFLLSSFLLSRYEILTSISLVFFVAALLLFFGFYSLNRGQFLRIEMGKNLTELDSRLIFETIEAHFKKEHSSKISLLDLEIINGKKLEVTVTFEKTPLEKIELAEVEKSLKLLFRERFGYSYPFYFLLKLKSSSL